MLGRAPSPVMAGPSSISRCPAPPTTTSSASPSGPPGCCRRRSATPSTISADGAPQAGALLLRGLAIGDLPPTPSTPRHAVLDDRRSELTLLTVACRLGEPVGYEPEHGGELVQNIVPTRRAATRQTSTSSRVELMFHTEAAFHPHRPRYLLLLCLRGDPSAATTLASIHEVLPVLAAHTLDVLFEPRFRTAVDESFLHGRANVLGAPVPVLRGDRDRPTMVFDADLMVGTDARGRRRAAVAGGCGRRPSRERGAGIRRPAGHRQRRGGARPQPLHPPLRRHRPLAAAHVRRRRPRAPAPANAAAG